MSFQLSDWWKDLLIKLLFLLALFKIGYYIYSIIEAYFTTTQNPLLPKYLPKYIAFPLCFLMVDWLVVAILSWRLIKNEGLLQKWFYPLLLTALVYTFFIEGLYLRFLMWMNPWGS